MTDPWKDLASLHTTSARGPHAPTGQRFRFIKMGLKTLSVVVVTLLALKTIEMKHRPALGPWHQTVLAQEFHADQYPTSFSFDDYLKLEDRLFQELDERIESQVAPSAENIFNR